ncbi:CST complex subunit TEN1 isoform 3-T7 [Thomomys bottae]
MLPKPGIYYLPWEVGAGHVPDGVTLRTFGRLCFYDMTQSRVTLRAEHRAEQHQVFVCTRLVEPFQAQVGYLYMVLGELEHQKDVGFVVKARVLTCVEGINLPLLERAVQEQRLYLQERDSCQYETSSPSSPHLLPHSSQSHCPPQPAPQATPTPLVATALYRSLPAS